MTNLPILSLCIWLPILGGALTLLMGRRDNGARWLATVFAALTLAAIGLRLVRAYLVMGDRDKAVGASGDARQAVANDAARLRQLNEGLKTLGLDG